MKLKYETPELKVVLLSADDVIATSGISEKDNWVDDPFTKRI